MSEAELRRRQRQNLEIQLALVDAGLLLPPPGTRRSSRSTEDMGKVSLPCLPAVWCAAANPAASQQRSTWKRCWTWLTAPDYNDTCTESEDDSRCRSITLADFDAQTAADMERERTERRLRRERRREREAARLEEHSISLGLPVYSKEKAEGEEVLDAGIQFGTDSEGEEPRRMGTRTPPRLARHRVEDRV